MVAGLNAYDGEPLNINLLVGQMQPEEMSQTLHAIASQLRKNSEVSKKRSDSKVKKSLVLS